MLVIQFSALSLSLSLSLSLFVFFVRDKAVKSNNKKQSRLAHVAKNIENLKLTKMILTKKLHGHSLETTYDMTH